MMRASLNHSPSASTVKPPVSPSVIDLIGNAIKAPRTTPPPLPPEFLAALRQRASSSTTSSTASPATSLTNSPIINLNNRGDEDSKTFTLIPLLPSPKMLKRASCPDISSPRSGNQSPDDMTIINLDEEDLKMPPRIPTRPPSASVSLMKRSSLPDIRIRSTSINSMIPPPPVPQRGTSLSQSFSSAPRVKAFEETHILADRLARIKAFAFCKEAQRLEAAEQDENAIISYERAAALGSPDAFCNIGVIYERIEPAKASHYFKMASNLQHSFSLYNEALSYQDENKDQVARELFMKAQKAAEDRIKRIDSEVEQIFVSIIQMTTMLGLLVEASRNSITVFLAAFNEMRQSIMDKKDRAEIRQFFARPRELILPLIAAADESGINAELVGVVTLAKETLDHALDLLIVRSQEYEVIASCVEEFA
jgi:tetratricopeptide (TPR) repeat protein